MNNAYPNKKQNKETNKQQQQQQQTIMIRNIWYEVFIYSSELFWPSYETRFQTAKATLTGVRAETLEL